MWWIRFLLVSVVQMALLSAQNLKDVDDMMGNITSQVQLNMMATLDQIHHLFDLDPQSKVTRELDHQLLDVFIPKVMMRLRSDLVQKMDNIVFSRNSREPLSQDEINRMAQTLALKWQDSVMEEIQEYKKGYLPKWLFRVQSLMRWDTNDMRFETRFNEAQKSAWRQLLKSGMDTDKLLSVMQVDGVAETRLKKRDGIELFGYQVGILGLILLTPFILVCSPVIMAVVLAFLLAKIVEDMAGYAK